MRRHGRRRISILVLSCALAVTIVALVFSLLLENKEEEQCFQFAADLGGTTYDENFLEKASKIRGIRQICPILEIPVRLKLEDYTMDTVWMAVDADVLEKKVQKAREVPLGTTPVLLLGKNSLAEMKDSNEHKISENQQKKFLDSFEKLELKYYVASQKADAENEIGEVQWEDCIVAGILSSPSEDIYLPYAQGRMLCEAFADSEIKKALITVQGKENYKKAQSYFEIQ